MKFYIEEITVLKNGTSPIAITEKPSENEAIASFHQAMASAIINPNVASIHCEAKNSVGGIYESGTWIAPVEPTPEPTDTTPEPTDTTPEPTDTTPEPTDTTDEIVA